MGVLLAILGFLMIFLSAALVERASKNKLYDSVEFIPHNRVGLLLGSAKAVNGLINLYYKYRIEAYVELYQAGKIEFVLVSGDNGRVEYDESSDMKDDLVALGVPEEKIYLDYAGFRTLDSVVRAKEIFGQTELTIISQEFHNKRALFIARQKGIEAIGYNAKDVQGPYGIKTNLREKLARVKMVLDVLMAKQPKYLGENIEIQ